MDTKADGTGREAWHMTDDLHAEHGKGDPFAAAIRATRMAMIITDPRQEDNPIVFANDAFLQLTGYEREQIVGSNCRFLQGPETDRETVIQIREAIADLKDINVDILNYRKDGTTFWNALYVSPVINEDGELQFFFASQLDVTDRKQVERNIQLEKERFERAVKDRTAELQLALEAKTTLLHEVDHRVKNNLQMVSSLIIMQTRTIPDETIRRSLHSMLERVEALSTVHRRLYQSDDVSRFDVADFIRDLVTDLVGASRHQGIKPEFDLQSVEVTAARAAPLALIVNELVTNALKHAFENNPEPKLTARLRTAGSHFQIDIEDNGSGMDGADGSNSFGAKLVKSLARQLKAEITWNDMKPGTRASINLPL